MRLTAALYSILISTRLFVVGISVPWGHLPLCSELCSSCLEDEGCRSSVEASRSQDCGNDECQHGVHSSSKHTSCGAELGSAQFTRFFLRYGHAWCRQSRGMRVEPSRPNTHHAWCMKLLKRREECMLSQLAVDKLEISANVDIARNHSPQGGGSGKRKLTIRSPSDATTRIHRWRQKLSADLEAAPLTRLLPQISCQSALNDICLKHIACRELWKIFRHSCVVDDENRCKMINRQDCWQSFEGISWTGLGYCACPDANSDCHWVRLLTNYNKCIDEIKMSGPGHHTAIQHRETSPNSDSRHPSSSNRPPLAHQLKTSMPTTTIAPTTKAPLVRSRTHNPRVEHHQHATAVAFPSVSSGAVGHGQLSTRAQAWPSSKRKSTSASLASGHTHHPQVVSGGERTAYTVVGGGTPPTSPETLVTNLEPPPIDKKELAHKIPPSHGVTSSLPPGMEVEHGLSFLPTVAVPFTTVGPRDREPTTEMPREIESKESATHLIPAATIVPTTPGLLRASSNAPPSPHEQSTTPTIKAEDLTRIIGPSITLPATSTAAPLHVLYQRTDHVHPTKAAITLSQSTTRETLVTSSQQRVQHQVITSGWPYIEKSSYVAKTAVKESTCQGAFKQCEDNESCRWHLSELAMKCASNQENCQRDQCNKAMMRFVRYVQHEMVETLIFCKCAPRDEACTQLRLRVFPRCLYAYSGDLPSYRCTELVDACQSESDCNRYWRAFNASCRIETGKKGENGKAECLLQEGSIASLARCREALVAIRGTRLDSPCYCNANDRKCRALQPMLPSENSCVRRALQAYKPRDERGKGSERFAASANTTRRPTPVTSILAANGDFQANKNTTAGDKSTEFIPVTPTSASSAPQQRVTGGAYSQHIRNDTLEDYWTISVSEKVAEKKNGLDNIVAISPPTASPPILLKPKPTLSTSSREPPLRPKVPIPTLLSLPIAARPHPPSDGGCTTRNIDGEWIRHHRETLFRQYHGWSGRCSSWCECTANETLHCSELGCLPDVTCEAPHTSIGFGEKLYLEGRGACICESGAFICEGLSDGNEVSLQLQPGLYITLGYSKKELDMMKEKMSARHLEKAGMLSPDGSYYTDLSSCLQTALERILPPEAQCRLVLVQHVEQQSMILLQVQWYGVEERANETQPTWHVGRMEKLCSPYVKELEYNFLLERSDRHQLLLSTVKMLRVIDLLDGLLPPSSFASNLVFVHPHLWKFTLLLTFLSTLLINSLRHRLL